MATSPAGPPPKEFKVCNGGGDGFAKPHLCVRMERQEDGSYSQQGPIFTETEHAPNPVLNALPIPDWIKIPVANALNSLDAAPTPYRYESPEYAAARAAAKDRAAQPDTDIDGLIRAAVDQASAYAASAHRGPEPIDDDRLAAATRSYVDDYRQIAAQMRAAMATANANAANQSMMQGLTMRSTPFTIANPAKSAAVSTAPDLALPSQASSQPAKPRVCVQYAQDRELGASGGKKVVMTCVRYQ